MRTAWETFPIELKGGLITNISPLQQGINAPGSATSLVNYEPSIEGGYKKILGYKKWTSYALPGTGLIRGVILTNGDSSIAVRGGIYYTSTAKNNWVSKLNIGDATGKRISFVRFNFNGTTKIGMVDGVHRPVFWDSSTGLITQDVAAPTDVLGATRIVEYKNRIFLAKGNLLTYTAPYVETDYSPANGAGVINVGDDITALITFRDSLIIFCKNQIKRLTGTSPSDYVLSHITANTGCLSGDTVREVGGDILYLGPDGIRYLSATEKFNDFGLARASEVIQKDVIDKIVGATEDELSSLVIRSKAQYRFFRYEPAPDENAMGGFLGTRFADQSASGVAWAEIKGFNVYASDSYLFSDKEYTIFANSDGYVYSMEDGFSLDGAPIYCYFKTANMPITDPQIRKTYYKHTLYTKVEGSLAMNARLVFDYGDTNVIQPDSFPVTITTSSKSIYGVAIYGTSTYATASRQVFKNNVIGSSFVVAIEYSETSDNPPHSLDTIVLEYKQNDRK